MDQRNTLVEPRSWLDSLGTTVSIACAIQCAFFPLLISILPLVGLSFLAGDGIEKVFLVTSITIALASFYSGVRYHKHLHIFLFLVGGVALIFTGRVWVDVNFEVPFVVSGTSVLAAGHFLNRRLCRLCATCADHLEKKNEAPCEPVGRHRRFWSSRRHANDRRERS